MRMVVGDVRARGFVASSVPSNNGDYVVRIATPWGTDTISDYREWLQHPAYAARQTPETPDDIARQTPKYGEKPGHQAVDL